jgi:ADP-dependent NAD(P)H-hydrate dehydratase
VSARVDEAQLRQMPLETISGDADKESRGRLLIIGGSWRVPGGPILSGLAGLRAGAGKVQLALPRSLAPSVGATFMEAGIIPLAETSEGDIDCAHLERVSSELEGADVILLGPGIMDAECGQALTTHVLQRVHGSTLVIDAMALTGMGPSTELFRAYTGRIIITPHIGEMAAFVGRPKEDVAADSEGVARTTSQRLNCTTVLKGSETTIAPPDGRIFLHRADNPGLATAGSGDVLCGLLAGLLARGNSPLTASLWAVHTHSRAGAQLAKRRGPIGFLARELLEEIPSLLDDPRDTSGH